MECKDADYVLAIAKCQSISKAANLLHITQPALTKYLRSLEEREEVALFTRSNTRMELTEAGECYVRYASEVARLRQELAQALKVLNNEENRTLRIGIAANGARNELMRSIIEVKKAFPNLSISITERTSHDLERLITEGELDVGFVSLPIENNLLQQEILYEEYVLLAVPTGSPFARDAYTIEGCPFPWIDLNLFNGMPFVLQNQGTRFRRITDQLMDENGLTVECVMTTRNKLSALEFSKENNWYYFTTSLFIPDEDVPTTHYFYAVGTPIAKAPIGLIYRRGTNLSASAKMLTKVLRKRLRLVTQAES